MVVLRFIFMKKTLCKLSLMTGNFFYLLQDEHNNLSVSKNPGDIPCPANRVVLVLDNQNQIGNNFEANFLSASKYKLVWQAETYNSLKDLLEQGFKIYPHLMPNLPVGHGPQMHNMAPVFNPQNQQNNNIVNQPQYITDQHFRSNHDNRNTSYGKTKYNNSNQYNKYANRQLIRELVTSPDRHIAALQNGGYGNERY